MKRRAFIRQAACGAFGALTAGQLLSKANAASGKQPNFVVIVADDAGWHDVGFHGSEIKTPNLDRMAANGVELSQFYVYPTCSPTRAGLMTGRPPSRFGITGPLQIKGDRGLPADIVTIAELLRRNGYDTAITGKWHLGMAKHLRPRNYGFNHSYGYVGPWIDSYTHDTTDFTGNMEPVEQWIRDDELIDEEGHVTDLITDEALHFIESSLAQDKPFFLYVPFSAPHVPCQEDLSWVKPYENTIENVSRRYFAAAMTHMDDCIGKLVAALEKKGLAEDTLVMFFSDNGGQKGGEYSRWLIPPGKYYMSYGATDVLGDNRPLNNWKGSIYEGGIRVPAFMYRPGHLKPGKCVEPAYVCDVYTTLAALAGVSIPADVTVEGIDIMPSVKSKNSVSRRLYWRTNWQAACREGDWKLIHRGRTLDEGEFELYNIAEDPGETKNVIAENETVATHLKQAMQDEYSRDKVR